MSVVRTQQERPWQSDGAVTDGGAYIFVVVVVVFVAVTVFACRRPHNASESGGETITARRDGVEQCRRQRTREKRKKAKRT